MRYATCEGWQVCQSRSFDRGYRTPGDTTMLKLNFDFIRDIVPVASIVRVPLVMEVHPSVPTKTVAEFIAYAKANPGKINIASAGIGSLPHVAGEMFKTMAGLDLFHVPYRGAQVFPALLAGQVQVYFGPLLSSIEYVRAGRLRALAVTTTTRSDAGGTGSERRLAGLQGKCMVRHWRSEEHARRAHRKTEQGSQHCRSKIPSAACQSGRHGTCRLARRFRQTHLRRDQEVG